MKVVVFDQAGQKYEISSTADSTLMSVIRDAGLDIAAQCGGCAACATCHVYVEERWAGRLEPVSDIEDAMLEVAEERKDNSRLSCQINLSDDLDGLTVTLAPGTAF